MVTCICTVTRLKKPAGMDTPVVLYTYRTRLAVQNPCMGSHKADSTKSSCNVYCTTNLTSVVTSFVHEFDVTLVCSLRGPVQEEEKYRKVSRNGYSRGLVHVSDWKSPAAITDPVTCNAIKE